MDTKPTDEEKIEWCADKMGWHKQKPLLANDYWWYADCEVDPEMHVKDFTPSTKIEQALEVLDECVDKDFIASYTLQKDAYSNDGERYLKIRGEDKILFEDNVPKNDCARKIMEVLKQEVEG